MKISELTGTNREFIMAKIPHLQHFVSDNLDKVVEESDVLVVTNNEPDFRDIMTRCPGKIIVDLVRAWKEVDYNGVYEGLSWGNINTNSGQNTTIDREIIGSEY